MYLTEMAHLSIYRYYNIFGCEGWGDYIAIVRHNGSSVALESTAECEHEAFPIASVVYFVSYIMAVTYV